MAVSPEVCWWEGENCWSHCFVWLWYYHFPAAVRCRAVCRKHHCQSRPARRKQSNQQLPAQVWPESVLQLISAHISLVTTHCSPGLSVNSQCCRTNKLSSPLCILDTQQSTQQAARFSDVCDVSLRFGRVWCDQQLCSTVRPIRPDPRVGVDWTHALPHFPYQLSVHVVDNTDKT